MSKEFSTIQAGFGQRLREERERLSFTQTGLAEIGGVKRLAQSQYERGTSSPTVRYLAAVAQAGVNLKLVLFGELPSAIMLSSDEQYRIERQAFELVEEHVGQQPEGVLGAEARFALYQLFKSQLTLSALSILPVSGHTAVSAQKTAA
jgi:transcriptional regulator with XRE-family HTH domain